MDRDSEQQKWAGNVSTKLRNATAQQIWPLLKDFFNLHHWFPTLSACYGIHGSNREPGCIRYCAGFSLPSNDAAVSWSKERLLAVDDVDRSLTYEIVESNIGFQSYESTIKVAPEVNDIGQQDGCVIDWRFTVDPVEGWVLDDLVSRYHAGLQLMAEKMEDAIANSVNEA